MSNLLSLTDYAKHVGCSGAAVTKLLKKGSIVAALVYLPGKKKPLVNVDIADQIRRDNFDPSRQKKKINTDQDKQQVIEAAGLEKTKDKTLNEARRQHEWFKAAKAKLDVDERRGVLVPAAEVEKEAFELGRQIRDAMVSIPDRISDQLAVETESIKIHEKLLNEIIFALKGLSE